MQKTIVSTLCPCNLFFLATNTIARKAVTKTNTLQGSSPVSARIAVPNPKTPPVKILIQLELSRNPKNCVPQSKNAGNAKISNSKLASQKHTFLIRLNKISPKFMPDQTPKHLAQMKKFLPKNFI